MNDRCKTCGAEILWAIKEDGKPIPLYARSRLVAVLISGTSRVQKFVTGHESHFATCPQAAQHRKPKQERLFEEPDPLPVDPDEPDVRRGHRLPPPQEFRR